MSLSFRSSVACCLFLLPAAVLAASAFSDVTTDYVYYDPIQKLSAVKVITGNPDGTFKPHDPINRAAILALLYRAAGKTPDGGAKKAFKDVQPGSWYEPFVLDAAAKGYVKGYQDGSFKPNQAVTRAEAIKMTLTVLGIPSAGLSADLSLYTDISNSDWFAPYLRTALANGILPIATQAEANFSASTLLERGEAAAYIWNALHPHAVSSSSSSSSSALSSSSQSSMSTGKLSVMTGSLLEQQRATRLDAIDAQQQANMNNYLLQENFPFTDSETFSSRKPYAYKFSVSQPLTADIVATLDPAATGTLSCTLFILDSTGYSTKQYLGFPQGNKCLIRAALTTGTQFQLQLTPSDANVKFSVTASATVGDGNDGYSQAQSLNSNLLRTGSLDNNDLDDWYTFTVKPDKNAPNGTPLTVKLVSASQLGCIIFPMSDVDLFGFSEPQCNQLYNYPSGTYVIDVRHANPLAERETYTVQVR